MSNYAQYEKSTCNGQPQELYKFSQTGADWLYTSGNSAYTHNNLVYNPETISRGEIDQKNDATASSVDITVPRTNPIAAKFIAYNPSSAVWVTIYRLHTTDFQVTYDWFGGRHEWPPEVKTIFIGRVVSVTFNGSTAVMKCSPLQGILSRNIPKILYQSVCNRVVYSSRCGVDQGKFTVSGIITAISGNTISSPAFANKPDGWFNHGVVIKGADVCRMIIKHVGQQLTLLGPIDSLAIGDYVQATAGCDRLETTCANKFNNRNNFLGWTNMPNKNPFVGGL